jgi:hypothetical protein
MRKLLIGAVLFGGVALLVAVEIGHHNQKPRAALVQTAPRDDCDLIVRRFGLPDQDHSTDVLRSVTYKKERVRWAFLPDKSYTPYHWQLVAAFDSKTSLPISPDKAVSRLALRDSGAAVVPAGE